MGLAEAILKAMGKTRDSLVYDRHGDDVVRKPGEIGMHALRIGDEIGRHTAYFAALGERLELTHVATNRDTFVHGTEGCQMASRTEVGPVRDCGHARVVRRRSAAPADRYIPSNNVGSAGVGDGSDVGLAKFEMLS